MNTNANLLDGTLHRNNDRFLISELGDELVMMDIQSGNYISVNQVGSDIWNLLEQPMTYEELVVKLNAMYDISEEQCRAETAAFLQVAAKNHFFTRTI